MNKLRRRLKAATVGALSGWWAIAVACAADNPGPPKPVTAAREEVVIPPAGTRARRGYTLFEMNCAHCHGKDARGDEGPDLHGLTKSDQRINSILQTGIKGEMPNFSAKLNEADRQALIAFLRTLKADESSREARTGPGEGSTANGRE